MLRASVAAAVGACLTFAPPALAVDHLYGIVTDTPTPQLVGFDAAAPLVVDEDHPLTGLGGSDSVIGMDVSPRDGGIYVLTSNAGVGRLYTVDPSTGSAT